MQSLEASKAKVEIAIGGTKEGDCACFNHLKTHTFNYKTQDQKVAKAQGFIKDKQRYIDILKSEKDEPMIDTCVGHGDKCPCVVLKKND
ncbi:hypothetical protein LCGC14_1585980 [marine sediment metagenome]|uniref:Uncharacterized protein n=1 Tax=marine sediment metagenome TaxID=412755 RepID=A0A0F9KW22_9ZZZZ